MEELKLHTPDLTAGNVEKLAALFPKCHPDVAASRASYAAAGGRG
jgi:hypothetical protein